MKTLNLKIYALTLFAGLTLISCKKEGCTDPLAINYDSNANHDDGMCVYDNSGTGGGSSTITDNVTVPTTWSGNISVCGIISIEAALTIDPGTVIVMCPGAGLDVETTGSLTAIGTATSPISISGEVNSAGYWSGINFSSNNPNNQLAYVTVRDGGSYWAWDYSNVYVNTQAQLLYNFQQFRIWNVCTRKRFDYFFFKQYIQQQHESRTEHFSKARWCIR